MEGKGENDLMFMFIMGFMHGFRGCTHFMDWSLLYRKAKNKLEMYNLAELKCTIYAV